MFDEAPDYNAPTMDTGARRAIDRVTQSALNATPESEQAAYVVGSTRGLLKDDGAFDQGLAYGSDPLMAAIRSRSQRGFDQEEKRLNLNTKMHSRDAYFNRLSQATNLAAEESRLNFEKEMARRKAKEAKKQARSAMIGSVLGIVGGVVGGVFGGPGGAMAGSAVGSAGGNYLGNVAQGD